MNAAADKLRELARSPIELLGPPEGVELAVTLSPDVAEALADLLDAVDTNGATHHWRCDSGTAGYRCVCGLDDIERAAARVEEALG